MSKYKPLVKPLTPTRVNLPDGRHIITGTQARVMLGKIGGAKVEVFPLHDCETDSGQKLGVVLVPFPGAYVFGDDEIDNVKTRDAWLIVVSNGQVIGGAPANQPKDISTIEEAIQEAQADKAERQRRKKAMDAFIADGNDPEDYESSEDFDEAFEMFYEDWQP